MSTEKMVIKIKEFTPDLIQPNSKTYHNKEQGGSKIVVIGKPGTGKCLAPGTPVLMYDGTIKAVEDIKIGELLMGDDSTPRTVLSTCSGIDTMYKVTQAKGDSYTVNAPHILSLKYKDGIVDIAVTDYLQKDKEWLGKYKGYKVPVEFNEKKIPVNPYYLGYYFGCLDSNVGEKSVIYTQSGLKAFLKNNGQVYEDELSLVKYIHDNKLYRNTNIPDIYKLNLGDIRLSLLAGLIDSIGTYDNNASGFDIVLRSEQLIDDLIFVAKSLGFSANKKSCIKRYGNKSYPVYKTFITGKVSQIPCNIVNLDKKHDKDVSRTRISLTCMGKGSYHGFQLDGNQRFLLGDFTVTHNTTLIMSLLYAKKDIYPVGLVMSGTEDSNHTYSQVFPSTFVYNKYEKDILRNFIQRQKISKEHLDNPWAVVLLDDCTDDPGIFRDPLQQGMYKRGRHWKNLYILSLQYCMDVKPVIRTNVDGTFILREPNLKNRKSLWENYAGIIPDFTMFCDILDNITDNFTALYIHNATTSNDLSDCLFWYKAKPIPKGFKFGCKEYWDFHNQRYNTEYKDPFISYN